MQFAPVLSICRKFDVTGNMSNILLRFKIFIVKKRYTLWKFPIFSPSSLILIFFGNKKEREREKEEVKMKIHRERTKDDIRVIFSRIKKKRMVERFAKDGQKVAVHARRGRSRNGSNVRRCLLSRRRASLLGKKQHWIRHLLGTLCNSPSPPPIPFSFFSRREQRNSTVYIKIPLSRVTSSSR